MAAPPSTLHNRNRPIIVNNGNKQIAGTPSSQGRKQQASGSNPISVKGLDIQRNSLGDAADDDDEVMVEQSEPYDGTPPKIQGDLEGGDREETDNDFLEGGRLSDPSRTSKKSPMSNNSKRKTNMRYSNQDEEEDQISFDDNVVPADDSQFVQTISGMGMVQQSGAFLSKSNKHSEFTINKQQPTYLSGHNLGSPPNNLVMGSAPDHSANFNFHNTNSIQKSEIKPFDNGNSNENDGDDPGEIMDDMSEEMYENNVNNIDF